jgi:hypothetical protein
MVTRRATLGEASVAKQFAAQEPLSALRFREKALWLLRALDSLPAPVPGGHSKVFKGFAGLKRQINWK